MGRGKRTRQPREARALVCGSPGAVRSGADYLEIYDQDHSDTEERFIAIGPIARGLVVIVWTERDDGTIRIISARWATRKEQDLYRNSMEKDR